MDLNTIKKDKGWQPFFDTNPFNNNFVEGFLSHVSDDTYGALFIEKVNGDKIPQLVLCTPKLNYPFDKAGHWQFPKAKTILRFEKLDGTNIFAYSYSDEKQSFRTYKTRLRPFVGDTKFGPFLDMWKEILSEDKRIKRLLYYPLNFSFELYGARNKHLIQYDVALAAALLFARDGQRILPPTEINNPIDCHTTLLLGRITKDYVGEYQQAQESLEMELKEVDGGYKGREGEVWYLQTEDNIWHLYKVKPHTIEIIHWAFGGIGKNVIITTCQNAFESWDEPTVEQIKELLKEEFSDNEIENVHYRIGKHLEEVKLQHIFQLEVLEKYKETGLNFLDDSSKVMRALSGKLDRKMMGRVFSILQLHTSK